MGKPYKLALRALVTRDAVTAELADLTGVTSIDARIEDGSVVAYIEVADTNVAAEVETRLGQYAITTRVSVAS